MVASRNGAGAGAAAESRESGESVSPASAAPAASPPPTNLRRVIDTVPPFRGAPASSREARGAGGRDAWTPVSDLDESAVCYFIQAPVRILPIRSVHPSTPRVTGGRYTAQPCAKPSSHCCSSPSRSRPSRGRRTSSCSSPMPVASRPSAPPACTATARRGGCTSSACLTSDCRTQGLGAERVGGFMANTDLFRVMMAAYGWEASPPSPTR